MGRMQLMKKFTSTESEQFSSLGSKIETPEFKEENSS